MLTDTRLFLQRAVFAALALASISAVAADNPPTLYHVEVILFSQSTPSSIAEEQWPETFGLDPVDHLLEVSWPAPPEPPPVGPLGAANASQQVKPGVQPPKAPPPKPRAPAPIEPYQFLGRENFKLASTYERLKRNPRYEVLLHAAWRQPTIDLKDNTAVYLYEGMDKPSAPPLAPPQEPSAPAQPSAAPAPPPAAETPPTVDGGAGEAIDPDAQAPRFSGTLKLALGRYLHVNLNVLFRQAITRNDSVNDEGVETDTPHTVLQGFLIDESRRIRIGEVHYFDHPVFGAIVLIAPVEKVKGVDLEKETVGAESPAPTTMPDD